MFALHGINRTRDLDESRAELTCELVAVCVRVEVVVWSAVRVGVCVLGPVLLAVRLAVIECVTQVADPVGVIECETSVALAVRVIVDVGVIVLVSVLVRVAVRETGVAVELLVIDEVGVILRVIVDVGVNEGVGPADGELEREGGSL